MRKLIRLLAMFFIPYYSSWRKFKTSTILPNGYWDYFKFRIHSSKIYWPKDKTCLVANARKIYVGINSKIGRPGAYIQGAGGIWIGDYVRFGPGVGILTSNHDLYNRDKYVKKPIIIGDYCWLGMHAMVMAGVTLGPSTIVGAGSVVTKSFPEGYCVIGGNPARLLKKLDMGAVKMPYHPEYKGYIPIRDFEKERRRYIDVDDKPLEKFRIK